MEAIETEIRHIQIELELMTLDDGRHSQSNPSRAIDRRLLQSKLKQLVAQKTSQEAKSKRTLQEAQNNGHHNANDTTRK